MDRRLDLIKPLVLLAGLAQAAVALAQPPQYGPPPGAPPIGGPPGGGAGGPPSPEDLLLMFLPPLPANVPKAPADLKNFEGAWAHDQPLIFRMERDMYGNKLPFTEKAKRIYDDRTDATYKRGSPYANASASCLPPGQQWQYDLNMPFWIFQSKTDVTIIFQEYHGRWDIRMNQPHRAVAGERAYMGDSVGHWDGNTLVVDTIGFKWPMWIDVDGTPASKNAHLVHRIRRIDYPTPKLEIISTYDDPEMYRSPISFVRTFGWRPDKVIFTEYNCEYQVGSKSGVSSYGLVPEPKENLE